MTDFIKLWADRPELTQLGTLLRTVFPDPRVAVASELVEIVASALPEEIQESLFGEVLDAVLGNEPAEETASVVGYYEAHAEHTRFAADQSKVHSFVAALPMVRVLLPETKQDIATKIGIVYAGDHRLYTLPLFVEHYAAFLGWTPTRVEVLTPARFFGARFAAVATYVLYDGDKIRGYVLEAGMATGEPMVMYASPEGAPIFRRSGYAPTPFSATSNFYRGNALFSEKREPVSLEVDVFDHVSAKNPHVQVLVAYQPVVELARVWPAVLTAQAAMRVAAIAERLGKPMSGVELVAPLLAHYGRALPWSVQP